MNHPSTQSILPQPFDLTTGERPPGGQSLERTLTEIRSGRRLEKIVSSIESFLLSQITRLDTALGECSRVVENDTIVQRILADFELQKKAWEVSRQAEILRLSAAGEELIRGWEQLEDERRKWSDKRSNDTAR